MLTSYKFMLACPFWKTKLLFGISLKSLSITIIAGTDFNFDGYRHSSLVWSIFISVLYLEHTSEVKKQRKTIASLVLSIYRAY